MWRFVLLTLLVLSAGCASTPSQLSLAHHISVPAQWNSGKATPGPPLSSDSERYVDAYERGWWACVHEYAKDMDWQIDGFWASSGWPAATFGWSQGTGDAALHIQKLIDTFGKEKVAAYLSEFKDSPWYEP